jgi:hypothetical protein
MTALLKAWKILEERLTNDGYDGLYSPAGGCACEVGNLAPCGQISGDCTAGWKVSCSCGDHDWHISSASDGELPDPCEAES